MMHVNLHDAKKNIWKKRTKKKRREKCDDPGNSENEQMRKDGKEGKTVTCDNIKDEEKEDLKLEDNKRNKEECTDLYNYIFSNIFMISIKRSFPLDCR